MARHTANDLLNMTHQQLEEVLAELSPSVRPDVIAEALAYAIQDTPFGDHVDVLSDNCDHALVCYDNEELVQILNMTLMNLIPAVEKWMRDQVVTIKEFGVEDLQLTTKFDIFKFFINTDWVTMVLRKRPDASIAPQTRNKGITIFLGTPINRPMYSQSVFVGRAYWNNELGLSLKLVRQNTAFE